MYSNRELLETENSRYRLLILNGIVAFPVWGHLLEAFQPEASSSLWLHYGISSVFLLLLGGSFFGSKQHKYLEWLMIGFGWVMLSHAFYITWISQLSYLSFCSFLIWVCCLLNVFPTKKSTWLLGFTSGLLGFAIAVVERHWQVHPIIVNVTLWSSIVPSLAANFTRIGNFHHLLEVREEMDTLFQKMKEGLIVFGADGSVKGCNPATQKILKLELDDLSRLASTDNTWDCFHETGALVTAEEQPIVRALKDGSEIRDQIMGVRRSDGGMAWIKLTASPFLASPDDELQSVLATFSDISEIKKNQKIIFEQQARLEATAKLTALGEMAAGVAHEINNPLAIITGKVYMIEKMLKTPNAANSSKEMIETSLGRIQSTVERIQKIVKGLQTFSSGGEQDPFEATNLSAMTEEALGFCHEKIEKRNIEIRLDLEKDTIFDCRPIQISQVLVNLIHNACDAIEHLDERWIHIWARSAHNTLVLKITDSGKGIPLEVQKKLMQPFFTTKEVGKGTGLGLSITKGLIHSHLGKFWLDSSVTNTTFIIQLPLNQQPQKQAS